MLHIVRYILKHPYNQRHKTRAIWRFISWQLRSRILRRPIVVPFTDKSKLVVHTGMIGATGNIYCGLHEFHDMAFLLHLLREEDTVLDVGANIGSYTVLASAHAGARSISIEPNPVTFSYLERNIKANQIGEKVTTYNIALGAAKGETGFIDTLDVEDHVAREDENASLIVPVETLDAVLAAHTVPDLIKIDVEGYETQVVAGATKTLMENNLKVIVIELAGFGARYGFDESKIRQQLLDSHFTPHQYNAFTRELRPDTAAGETNTIFIRDMDFVRERIRTAPPVRLPQMTL